MRSSTGWNRISLHMQARTLVRLEESVSSRDTTAEHLITLGDWYVQYLPLEDPKEKSVRPNVLTRVNNSCIAFVQSPMSLVELDHQE